MLRLYHEWRCYDEELNHKVRDLVWEHYEGKISEELTDDEKDNLKYIWLYGSIARPVYHIPFDFLTDIEVGEDPECQVKLMNIENGLTITLTYDNDDSTVYFKIRWAYV